MKFSGTRGHIEIEDGGKTAWFGGEMGIDGFYAFKSSMRWLPPYDDLPVSESDLAILIEKVEQELRDSEHKIFFVD